MSALSPEVEAIVESGEFAGLDLIRFDLPGKTVGYHRGGRPFTYNGLEYLPNRFLEPGDINSAVGIAVTTRTIVFSNIPVTDPNDAIAQIEQYDYPNAPVIITHLAGAPGTNEVIGILASNIYEIDRITFSDDALDAKGAGLLTLTIELQPPGRSARGQTLVKRSQAEQQFDNDATDTGLEYVATVGTIPEEWGQVSR
ncbi:hypothetical protein AC244_16125 [Ensifer adhaerens]|uniref:DUF2163 domain-containing protein n=1 Tax=Ensifer adhaerens TaxID=106592 RepID=A0A0L8BTP4_ENSAD|nr:DUF2163 domain-containing protein [Ensifer adhaerens]KOF17889.1 hypothetical protein AC244_16125 [Ensifer adhaerens]